jgi:acylphosphatase
MQHTYQLKIYGHVQGVGFRYATKINAQKHNVTGYVKNLPDGSVYVVATGDQAQLAGFISWCRQGPPMARVEDVKIEDIPLRSDQAFHIR